MLLLTKSRLKTKRTCSRLHYLRYTEGYRPVAKREPLMFGTLMHDALEAWWKTLPTYQQMLAKFIDTPDQSPLERAFSAIEKSDADPFSKVKAQELMRGYHFRWKDEPFEVLAVEAEFRCPIFHPLTGEEFPGWKLAGKVDVILRDHRGRVLVMEHKTSSEDITPGSRYWLRLRIDDELPVYLTGAEALGFNVDGGVYDVISKPVERPLRATKNPRYRKDGGLYANQRLEDETPESYRERIIKEIVENSAGFYQRGEVVRLQDERVEAMLDLWADLETVELERRNGYFPRNPGGCDKHGGCEFVGVCGGSASLDDETLFTKSTVIHPELEEA